MLFSGIAFQFNHGVVRMIKPLILLLLPGLMLVSMFGCNSRREQDPSAALQNKDRPAQNGITVEVDGKRLPPSEEKAFAELGKSLLSEALGKIISEFAAKVCEALEITDDIESELLSSGLNSLEHGKHIAFTVYLFRNSPELKSPKTTEIRVDGELYMRFCRVPSSTTHPYAIVHHQSRTTKVIRDYHLVYDPVKGWQSHSIQVSKQTISFDSE